MKHICLLCTIFMTSTLRMASASIVTFESEKVKNHHDYPHEDNSAEFGQFRVVEPKIYNSQQKGKLSTKNQNASDHPDHLIISVMANNKELILDLTLNKELVPEGFFRKIQDKGIDKVVRPTFEGSTCHYHGKVRNRPDSWVALSTCDGLSGVIYDGNQMHYIEKKDVSENNVHVLYTRKDAAKNNKNNKTKHKRSVAKGPVNSNKESRYVELILVVDNRKYRELNESTEKVEIFCKNIANVMNGLYAPLNVFIALVGIVIWTEKDEIDFSSDPVDTLTNFLSYRRNKLIRDHPNDNAQLVTKFDFKDGVQGKALSKTICTAEYSGGICVDHYSFVGLTATTVAHMLGHNFGMTHDSPECKCTDPSGKCIMNSANSSTAPVNWSSCSVDELNKAFSHGLDYCLRNKPRALFKGSVCGNGFVEAGEECDCGLPSHCNNSCCDASTCKLNTNANCATGECCDLKTCNLKEAGTLCRSAENECDLPEYCTDYTEYCPPDVYKMDTVSCKSNEGYCYQGDCHTRTDHCKLLWGETGHSSEDPCYRLNLQGNRHGHCGYDKLNKSYVKCNEEDVFCGELQCQHQAENLQFGLEAAAVLSHSFVNSRGAILSCRTAVIDLGLDNQDPGLVPDGTKCGESKICIRQKCVSTMTLQDVSCPHNCYDNGWCNSLGYCHCKPGYARPFCQHLHSG